MKVHSIFITIQGEGLYSGAITTFIRFAGCHLRCDYCDTRYAQNNDDIDDVGVPYIIDKVTSLSSNPRYICITGGEPLEQPQTEMFNLLQALQNWCGAKGLESIVIETNGAQNVSWLLDKPFRSITSLSVDYKLPCSGQEDKMLLSNFKHLGPRDAMKFVCKDKQDVDVALNVLDKLKDCPECQPVVLFHALGGKASEWLPKLMLSWGEELKQRWALRYGIQLHKLVNMQ